MDTTMAQAGARPRQPLAALSKLTIVALLGSAGMLVFAQVVSIGRLHPPLTVFAVIMLIIAGIIATGRRWAPLARPHGRGLGWSLPRRHPGDPATAGPGAGGWREPGRTKQSPIHHGGEARV